jgi:LysR family glycine cleavage system transcriptional activator
MPDRRIRKTEQSAGFERLPLNALRVFEAVATQLSFAEAAERLHVTPAAVSMQVRTLEQYLQVPLFRRTGRSIELTPEGALLLPGVRSGLADLAGAVQQLRRSRTGGEVNVSTLASLLQKWLLPRLPQLRDRHPGLELRIHTSRQPVDFAKSDFHAAIRMSAGPVEGLHSELLLQEWFVLVCSPELYRRLGPVRNGADLKRYPLLRSSDEPWSLWRHPDAEREWKEQGTAFDDSVAVLLAAEQGQGLALTRWCLAAHDIRIGRLAQASPLAVRCPRDYYFVCPEGYLALPKLQRLLAWLREEAAAFTAAGGPAGAPGTAAGSALTPSRTRSRKPGAPGRVAGR